MTAYIKALAYYIPEQKVNNEDLSAEFPQWSVDKISSKTGIYSRGKAKGTQTASDLAFEAALKLFEMYPTIKDNIDFILFCTQSPDYKLPTTACILQDKLGLPCNIGALDFNLGCSGYVYGLSLAKGLASSGIARNILLLTGETYTKYLHNEDKGNRTIFGDGASATIVSGIKDDAIFEIGDFVFGTDGSGAENLIIKNGGARNSISQGENIYIDDAFHHNDNFLYMNGSEIFNFTSKKVPILVNETLNKNSLHKEDIDLFVFHQANKFMMDFIRKKLNIQPDRFFYCLEEFGNTVSSTIPIALSEAHKQSRFNKGNNLLIAGFGVGYSWAGAILKAV